MANPKLKDHALYVLPDGRRFIVCENGTGEYVLFTPESWEQKGRAEYRINQSGRIISRGAPTRWRIEELVEVAEANQLPKVKIRKPYTRRAKANDE